jgi:hypothetical protein
VQVSIIQNQNQINIHETGLSTLYNFRSDNSNSIVRLTGPSIFIRSPFETLFDSSISNSNFLGGDSQSAFLTKIDETGKINVFHPYNILLPNKFQGFGVVHDEIEGFHQQAIINAGKFLLHDGEIEAVGSVALTAAQGVAAITLYLGFSSLANFLTGNNGGAPAPIDVSGIFSRISNNQNNLNSLSTTSTLSINNLNSTTTSILGYINGSTAFSSLNVSGFTTLNNNTPLLSSLNVSGFTIFNNNVTLLSSINISGFATLNDNTSIFGTLNVS